MAVRPPAVAAVLRCSIVVAWLAVASASAGAETTLNLGARLSHDSNVNGAPSSGNRQADTALAANATAGWYRALDEARSTYLIGQLGATATAYRRYGNLDHTLLLGNVGLYGQLAPEWTAQLTARLFHLDTQQSTRDAHGRGLTVELKRQLTPQFWVKALADHEHTEARSATFSYSGPTLGVALGWMPREHTFVTAGYSRNRRDFRSTPAFETRTDTFYVEVARRVAKNWYVSGGYAFRDHDSNVGGIGYASHLVSLGLSYSF